MKYGCKQLLKRMVSGVVSMVMAVTSVGALNVFSEENTGICEVPVIFEDKKASFSFSNISLNENSNPIEVKDVVKYIQIVPEDSRCNYNLNVDEGNSLVNLEVSFTDDFTPDYTNGLAYLKINFNLNDVYNQDALPCAFSESVCYVRFEEESGVSGFSIIDEDTYTDEHTERKIICLPTQYGTVTASSETVKYNGSATITVTPNRFYKVSSFKVDNEERKDELVAEGGAYKFVLNNIVSNCEIKADFSKVEIASITSVSATSQSGAFTPDSEIILTAAYEPAEAEDNIKYTVKYREEIINLSSNTFVIPESLSDGDKITVTAYSENNVTKDAEIIVANKATTDDIMISGEKGNNNYYLGDVTITPKNVNRRIFYNGQVLEYVTLDKSTPESLKIQLCNKNGSSKTDIIDLGRILIDKNDPVVEENHSDGWVSHKDGIYYYNDQVELLYNINDINDGINQYAFDNFKIEVKKDGSYIDVSMTDGENCQSALFTEDGSYEATVMYEDEAGRKSQKLVYKFVIDTVAPEIISIDYNEKYVKDDVYYKSDGCVRIRVKESNPDNYKTSFIVNGTSINAQIDKSQDEFVYTLNIPQDGVYQLNISCVDMCGYSGIESGSFVIDTTSPQVTILPMEQVNVGNIFNQITQVKISVTDTYITNDGISVYVNGVEVSSEIEWQNQDNTTFALLDLNSENYYNITCEAADVVGNIGNDEYNAAVDLSDPVNLHISLPDNTIATMLNTIVYNGGIRVNVSADDSVSGIDRIEYECVTQSGYSAYGKDVNGVILSDHLTYNGERAFGNFLIPEQQLSEDNQFRGTIKITAYDKSGRSSEYVYSMKNGQEGTIVVVDSVSPKANITLKNTDVKNGKYYKQKQTAVISVTETNFKPDSTYVYVTRTVNGKTQTYTVKYDDLLNVNSKGNVHYGSIEFDKDGIYSVSVQTTDMAGHLGSDTEPEFVIDKTRPVIKIQYDNNDVENNKYFNKPRTLVITATEKNFNAEDVRFSGSGYDFPDKSEWKKINGNYQIKIVFNRNKAYEFGISYADMAENSCIINTLSSASPYSFVVDTEAPHAQITLGKWSESLNGTVWNQLFKNIRYNLFSRAALSASVKSADDLSGVYSLEYAVFDNEKSVAELKKFSGWTKSAGASVLFKLTDNTRNVVYARVKDYAGNVSYINSDGVIIDSTAPGIEKLAPEISISPQQPVNGLYNNDVKVKINVQDVISGKYVYSGLKTVSYRVLNNNSQTQAGILFTFDKSNALKSDLVQSWSGSVTVDSVLNNSNNISVEIIALDNCGNRSSEIVNLKIDRTAPEIEVVFDNNTSDKLHNDVYKEVRTAEIRITERNFNSAGVKLDISNTDGKLPVIGEWNHRYDRNDPDNSVHTAKIAFIDDGDYSFDISYSDEAGNDSGSVNYGDSRNPHSFTIDRTNPVISVTYDNNEAKNGSYYSQARTATITVREHNFDVSRTKVKIESSLDGKAFEAPVITEWKSSGDARTAKVTFSEDGFYTFTVEASDAAGNKADGIYTDGFYIDGTSPQLKITGIDCNSANNGDVIGFTAEAADVNFSGADVKLKYITTKNGKYEVRTVEINDVSEIKHGLKYIAANLENDGMYTLECTVSDLAGNVCTKAFVNGKETDFSSGGNVMEFSVNRNGSTFKFGEETEKMNKQYLKKPSDVVIIETNPDVIEPDNTSIVVYKDDQTIKLTDEQYVREQINGEGEWYQYKYTIKSGFFAKDGVYRIAVSSVDKAENVSESVASGAEMNFAIDNTAPKCIVADLKSSEVYNTRAKNVTFEADDNIRLNTIAIYLNDKLLKEYSAEEIQENFKENKSYDFTISAGTYDKNDVKIILTDAAGNEETAEYTDVIVTTSRWVLFYTNTPLLIGSIVFLILLIAAVIFIIVRKSGKNKSA